jgi:hypothetical protein
VDFPYNQLLDGASGSGVINLSRSGESMKTFKENFVEEARTYWRFATRASWLTFLSSKRAGINVPRPIAISTSTDAEFVEQFLKEQDGRYANPSPYKQRQPDFYHGGYYLVKTIYNHRFDGSRGSLNYAKAFECTIDAGRRKYAFSKNYVELTREYAANGNKISLFQTLVFLYRNAVLKSNISLAHLRDTFVREFHVTNKELERLFDDDLASAQTSKLFTKH